MVSKDGMSFTCEHSNTAEQATPKVDGLNQGSTDSDLKAKSTCFHSLTRCSGYSPVQGLGRWRLSDPESLNCCVLSPEVQAQLGWVLGLQVSLQGSQLLMRCWPGNVVSWRLDRRWASPPLQPQASGPSQCSPPPCAPPCVLHPPTPPCAPLHRTGSTQQLVSSEQGLQDRVVVVVNWNRT